MKNEQQPKPNEKTVKSRSIEKPNTADMIPSINPAIASSLEGLLPDIPKILKIIAAIDTRYIGLKKNEPIPNRKDAKAVLLL
ncbi:MAG: hypothetical protein IKT46_09065 [Clostridia bacterium]|nr:hypothetical protein [Clostridia bacterium]